MSFQLHLIVVVISLLAESYRGVGQAVNAKYKLPEHFQWSKLGPTTIELRWDADRLASRGWSDLIMVAFLPSTRTPNYTHVPFSTGKAAIDGLLPKTLYNVSVETYGARSGELIWLGPVETSPIGKLARVTMMCISMSVNVMVIHIGKGQSAATSSASVSTSTVSGLVSACIAAVIASAFA
ncbi:hypothetical protein EGR_08805 [Echinococcus granulosus]|uniref:Uncharacterized protein n=1 Tax=Echinococcus granulosus TaxID=6210 RepID=W6U5C2_ECHGR|nr:hypothetical protein EGR_08805 [Echinococcus granulosus]EUB56330.1 hypothetical protein EGR_08805 [Echinococcus granulosus]